MRWAFRLSAISLVASLSACESMAPTIRTGACRAPDGLEIVYDVRGGGEPTLLFVHCWGGSRAFWREQLDAFAEHHRVVALDLGGHGASGRMRTTWSIPDLAGDVQAVADVLALERMVLIGHSMGGPVCLEAARRMPGRVVGIVAVDTLHDVELEFPPGFADRMAAQFQADFTGTMEEFVRSMFSPEADPAVVDWVVAQASAIPDREALVALMRGFESLDLKEMLAQAGVPIRAINAAPPYGMPTSVEHNREFADFDAVLIEGVGHFLQLERPEEFNERLRQVLLELGGGSS